MPLPYTISNSACCSQSVGVFTPQTQWHTESPARTQHTARRPTHRLEWRGDLVFDDLDFRKVARRLCSVLEQCGLANVKADLVVQSQQHTSQHGYGDRRAVCVGFYPPRHYASIIVPEAKNLRALPPDVTSGLPNMTPTFMRICSTRSTHHHERDRG